MEAEVRQSIGEKITALREKRGISTYRLALEAGVDPGGLGKIEAGEYKSPQIPTLKKLAKALGCTLDELAGD